MKRIWMNVGVTLGTALITGAIVSACAHNDASIFIRQVMAPPTPSNGLCLYTPDPTQPFLSVGVQDLSISAGPYSPEILLGNQILSQANVNQLQAETSRVIINGAITRITDLSGNTSLVPLFAQMYAASGKTDLAARAVGSALQSGSLAPPVNPFSTVEASSIEASTGTTASFGVLAATIVDSATVAILSAYFESALTLNPPAGGPSPFGQSIELLTYTKVEGRTLGGDPVESNEFEFPVRFTFGGLISNLETDPNDPKSSTGFCVNTKAQVPTSLQSCVEGQDIPIIVGPQQIPGVPACPNLGDGGIADASTGG